MELLLKKYGIPFALILFMLFLALSIYVHANPINTFDVSVTQSLQSQNWATPLFTTNKIVRAPAFRIIYIILIAIFVIMRRYGLNLFVAAAALSELLTGTIKTMMLRPRPYEKLASILDPTDGYSFVSGHTLEYTVMFWFLSYLVFAEIKTGALRYVMSIGFFLLPIIVGLGRVYTGAHWATDVIGSYLLGAMLLTLMKVRFKRAFEQKRRLK